MSLSFLFVFLYLLGSNSAIAHQSQTEKYPLCKAWKSSAITNAMTQYPHLKSSLQKVEEVGVVPWYTDNTSPEQLDEMLNTLVRDCGNTTRIPIVVYGIPGKDCAAGFSNKGHNTNIDDYKLFLTRLVMKLGDKKVVYILEPDAVGLTANGGCGNEHNYREYLRLALNVLSVLPNAEIFLDVGYWVVESNAKEVSTFLNEIWPHYFSNSLKGIALNTANYRSTHEMSQLCNKLAQTSGRDLQCIIDTSRNNKGPNGNEWCNAKYTGIGSTPTESTSISRIAYFLWVKPPGESDGECTGQSSEALRGPSAGAFFPEHFETLWNNGIFVSQDRMAPI